MYLQWNQSMRVGHTTIDDQHRELIDAINNLMDAMTKGAGRQELGKLIDFLQSYVVKHFGAEEQMMRQRQLSCYPAHKAQHDAFVKDFLQLKAEIDQEGPSAATVLQVQRRVCDWVRQHIMRTDKELAALLAGKSQAA